MIAIWGPYVCVHFLMPGHMEPGRNALRNPCSAAPARTRKAPVDENYNNDSKLIDLLDLVDYKAHVVAIKKKYNDKGNVVDRITATKLVSGNYPMIAEYCNGNGTSSIHFRLFSNGLCLFEAEDRHTVFDIVEFVLKDEGYHQQFEKEIDGAPESCNYSIEQLLIKNWVVALMPYAENRITINILNDSASRPGKNINEVTNVDNDGDNMGYPTNVGTSDDLDLDEKVVLDQLIYGENSPLTKKQRKAVILLLEGYTHEEIAAQIGGTRRNISYLIERAISAMKDHV